MAVLLEKIQWSDQPLLTETIDAAWEAEVVSVMGMMPSSLRRAAASPWVRRAYFDAMRPAVRSLTDAQIELAALVTSQENACRYCYGVGRASMRMLGFTDEVIDQVEGRAQLAEADQREREMLAFCRNLARSKPRPSRDARRRLEEIGFTPIQVTELAYIVASAGLCNRMATLLAVPPELELERMVPPGNLWKKLSSWLPGHAPSKRPKPPSYPEPSAQGPFAVLTGILAGSPAAGVLQATLQGALESSTLPRRTALIMFAVIARTLDCDVCEAFAVDRLEEEAMPKAALTGVLATLASKDLTAEESLLVPWARETVWMPEEPKRIQERTRPLLEALGPTRVLEAIGTAAIANACVRLAMLLQ